MNRANLAYQQKTERLADAFRVFNELSENLTQSYQALQLQVAQLNQQLAAARSERLATLIEKEQLASRLQQILAALPAAVVVVNAEDDVIDCNSHALEFLGEPLLAQSWQAVMARSLLPVADSPHERCLKDGRIVSLSRSALSNAAEHIILMSDISELRGLQDMVAQQKQLLAMGKMVASLAHQIRTPLATAILYASQWGRPNMTESKRQQFSEKILERLHFLERQVNDMLIYAKQGRLAMQGFAWRHLMASVAEHMEQFPGVFERVDEVEASVVLGNEDALRGVLLNLLNNAIEAGADTISLQASQSEAGIEITLRDNGQGMTEAVQAKLFEPFYTTKTHGTGLGLAVVDNVVKAHHGAVRCESKLGQGSCFSLTLPIIPAPVCLSWLETSEALQEETHETV